MIKTTQRAWQRVRARAASQRSPTAIRPSDAAEAHASGRDPIRVLLAGGDVLTGWGVRTHDLALPGQIARALSAATGRGVDIAVALDPFATSESLLPLLRRQRLDNVDAITLHLGQTNVQLLTNVTRWTAELSAAVNYVRENTADTTAIVIMGISAPSRLPYLHARPSGILDQHAALLNEASAAFCSQTARVTFLDAPAYAPPTKTGEWFGRPEHYRHWARHEATNLLLHLSQDTSTSTSTSTSHSPHAARASCPTADTAHRIDAINQLTWNTDTDSRVDRIIRQAKTLFDVDTVTFAIATTDELVHYLHVGGSVANVPFEGSFCWDTLQKCGTHVIRDTWAEKNPARRQYPARFYAGHPVLAPDGTPIGTLSLLSAQPPADDVDCVLLRDLTLQIQKALNTPALDAA